MRSQQLGSGTGGPGQASAAFKDLCRFDTLAQLWEAYDKGTTSLMSWREMEELQGATWRADPPGDKTKLNGKRW